MKILHSAVMIIDGQLDYIVMIGLNGDVNNDGQYVPDGEEVIIHNGTVYDTDGGTGIPSYDDTNFYTIYSV